jgi:hypothetical protein
MSKADPDPPRIWKNELAHMLRAGGGAIVNTASVAVNYPGASEGDVEAFLKPDTVLQSFAQDLPESDRWLIAAGQRPITLSANTTPSGPPAWKSLPSWVVIGTEDRVIPPGTQRQMAERANATITEVAGSHVSMVSHHPQVSIDAILADTAGRVLGSRLVHQRADLLFLGGGQSSGRSRSATLRLGTPLICSPPTRPWLRRALAPGLARLPGPATECL